MALIKPVSDKFSGYSEAAMETLVAMKGLINLAPQELRRLKHGCTFEQCQFGFLSPRMHFVHFSHLRTSPSHDLSVSINETSQSCIAPEKPES
jgi:hypothetical protein